MRFDRDKFWTGYRQAFGKVNQKTVDAIEFLLTEFESTQWSRAKISYALATIKHETANTFLPITEYGSKAYFNKYNGRADLGNTQDGDGYRFRGRGYVQITGRKNYEKYHIANSPELALEPATAVKILIGGMSNGTFTGKKLSDYISESKVDYINARRIINGTDKAQLIAGYAKSFEKILNSAVLNPTEKTAITPAPKPPPEVQTQGPSALEGAADTSTSTTESVTQAVSSTGESVVAKTTTTDANVAVGKEEQVGFFKKIWKELTGWTIFQGGLATLQSYKASIDAFGLPGWIIAWAIVAAGIAFLLWFTYQFVMHILEWWGKRSRTNVLAQVNSTATNSVTIVPQDQLDTYEKLGWVVIRRQPLDGKTDGV